MSGFAHLPGHCLFKIQFQDKQDKPADTHYPHAVPTNDTFSKGGTFESGQAQISYFHRASGAGDEDVVTLEVTVNDGWCACVQKVKPFEDLTTPALQQLQLHLLEPLQVPEQGGPD